MRPGPPPSRLAGALAGLLAGLSAVLPGGAALAAGPATGPRPDRPLGVVTPGPARSLFIDPPLADARAGSEPGLELRWWAANNWSLPTKLARGDELAVIQLDAQTDVLSLTARLAWDDLLPGAPLADRLELAVEARVVHHWGGWTDGPIEAWHRLGRFNDFGRPGAPQDAVALRLSGAEATVSRSAPVTGLGDVALRTSLRLAEGEPEGRPWAVAVRFDVKLPTGRPADLTGSGGFDAALALTASGPLLGWLTGHAQVSVGRVSRLPPTSPLQPRPWPLAAEVSLAARLGPDWVILVEDRIHSALFERGWRLVGVPAQGDAVVATTRVQNQATFGLRWRGVTAWLSEDFMLGNRDGVGASWFYDSNAPDVAIGISVAR